MQIRDQFFAADLTPAEKQQFDRMLQVVYQSTRVQQQVIDLMHEGRFEEAGHLLQKKSLAEQAKALAQYDAMLETQRRLAEEAASEARVAYQRSMIFMLTLSGAVIMLGIAVSIYTVKRTNRAERTLHEINEDLERRVNERTQALSEANQNLQGTIRPCMPRKTS